MDVKEKVWSEVKTSRSGKETQRRGQRRARYSAPTVPALQAQKRRAVLTNRLKALTVLLQEQAREAVSF